jgi:hypothetical protein
MDGAELRGSLGARYLWSPSPRLPLILARLLAVLSLLPPHLLAFIVLPSEVRCSYDRNYAMVQPGPQSL